MIEVNDAEVNAAFARMLAFGTNPAGYLGAIGNAVADNTRLRFRDSKAPDGSGWAPLSPVTIALRRGRSDKPLLDTGVLRNSITSKVKGDSVFVGTNARQARMQHYGARKGAFTRRGAPIPWGNVPGRPIFGVSAEDRSQIVEILTQRFTGDKS